METGQHGGGLEVRRGRTSTTLAGRFPYNSLAVLSDGGRRGRPKKERFAPRAFEYRIGRPDEDITLLVGHDYGKPLASRAAGSLDIVDGDDAVTFEADISDSVRNVSHVADVLALIAAGLAIGISPGFRLPPERAVRQAEVFEDEGTDPENGAFNAQIRTILAALLYELSIVTRPAYPDTIIESRLHQAPIARTGRARWLR